MQHLLQDDLNTRLAYYRWKKTTGSIVDQTRNGPRDGGYQDRPSDQLEHGQLKVAQWMEQAMVGAGRADFRFGSLEE